jgi:hypothetical protein
MAKKMIGGGHEGTARRARIDERRRRMVELRCAGWTWQKISDELGYGGPGNACRDLNATLKRNAETLALSVEAYRELELERLDDMTRRLEAIYTKRHPILHKGEIVRDENDAPLEDDGPLLMTIDRLLKVSESRRKLLGTDSPDRAVTEIQFSIDGINSEDLP